MGVTVSSFKLCLSGYNIDEIGGCNSQRQQSELQMRVCDLDKTKRISKTELLTLVCVRREGGRESVRGGGGMERDRERENIHTNNFVCSYLLSISLYLCLSFSLFL